MLKIQRVVICVSDQQILGHFKGLEYPQCLLSVETENHIPDAEE